MCDICLGIQLSNKVLLVKVVSWYNSDDLLLTAFVTGDRLGTTLPSVISLEAAQPHITSWKEEKKAMCTYFVTVG